MPLFKQRKSREPTITEHSAEAPRWNFDLVEEINLDWLHHMVKVWRCESGKFIRLGNDLVLVAPFQLGSEVTHKSILEQALKTKDRDFKQRVVGAQALAAATQSRLLDESGIQDAGRFLVEVGPNEEVSRLLIDGESGMYGSANKEGREHTVAAVQQRLGSEVEVFNKTLIRSSGLT